MFEKVGLQTFLSGHNPCKETTLPSSWLTPPKDCECCLPNSYSTLTAHTSSSSTPFTLKPGVLLTLVLYDLWAISPLPQRAAVYTHLMDSLEMLHWPPLSPQFWGETGVHSPPGIGPSGTLREGGLKPCGQNCRNARRSPTPRFSATQNNGPSVNIRFPHIHTMQYTSTIRTQQATGKIIPLRD